MALSRYDKARGVDDHGRQLSPQAKAIFADKVSYITFLEGQLDKVTNALYITNSVKEKYEQVSKTVEDMDTKLVNTTKVLKLLQTFVDSQEDENMQVKERIRIITNKLDSCADACLVEPSTRAKKLEARLEQRLVTIFFLTLLSLV